MGGFAPAKPNQIMSSLLSIGPNSVLSPFTDRTRSFNPLLHRTHSLRLPNQRPLGTAGLVRFGFGFNHLGLPDPESADGLVRELFGRAEGFLFTVADAAVSSSSSSDAVASTKQSGDWLSGITYGMESVLKVESAMAMRSLAPQIKAIQQRYAGDQERIQLETARLYKLAGINPLAGCLPTLATIPVWIGLYRALSNVANEDGHPPLGWSDTLAYLVLPVLLVLSQYVSVQIMQSSQSNDPSLKTSQAITKFLPLMIGYFSLSVPSG
ncbi:unnamed protein product [Thlaspi arvense]|uniref:Membrane insertase YidC/Oxa/ALB C-terminal domain-containing protein n=1 Tax=Thlaspi arvense TaxID=13288 RepID=A0AAU9RJE1_THLAR|nr:unnamed protein product [Thlaspi arvense]